jgi:hypothetical protein
VRVMNLKDDDLVSAVALVVDTGDDADADPQAPMPAEDASGAGDEPVDDASGDVSDDEE